MNTEQTVPFYPQNIEPTLERLLLEDITSSISSANSKWLTAVLTRLLTPSVREISCLARAFDSEIQRVGLHEATKRFLPRLTRPPVFKGEDQIPLQGPLLVIANHPGTFDALLVLSKIPRDDIKIVASDRPFFRALPAFSTYLIFSSRVDRLAKANVVRQSIQHLQSGGVLFLLAAGRLEPDPAREPEKSLQTIQEWSPSIEVILSRAPATQVQVAVLSNLITPEALDHPLIKFQKDPYKARIAAEVVQIWTQMEFKRIPSLTPKVVFSPVFSLKELKLLHEESPLNAVQSIARNLIRLECNLLPPQTH